MLAYGSFPRSLLLLEGGRVWTFLVCCCNSIVVDLHACTDPQPGVLSQGSSARIPQPGILSKESSARKSQSGILSRESSARIPQPGVLTQESSARNPQPAVSSQSVWGPRWSHFMFCDREAEHHPCPPGDHACKNRRSKNMTRFSNSGSSFPFPTRS